MPPDPARAEAAGPRRDPPRHLPSRQTGRDHPGVTSVAMSGQGSVAASEVAPQSIHYLQVQTTTDSRAEAMELARGAVEQRLAACAQVAGPIASMYWWEDGIERAEEWLLMLKLPAAGYQALADFLTRRHSYDEPEIIATPIVAGTSGYLAWIDQSIV